jgi:hypothetical protein
MIQRFLELERRMAHLERRLGQIDSKATQAGQNAAQVWGGPWQGGGTGGAQSAWWAMSPAGGMAASTGSFPTITPSTATLTVYQDVGGTFTSAGTAVCRWFFRDALPQYMLIALQPNGDGSYDILLNGCTIVNP